MLLLAIEVDHPAWSLAMIDIMLHQFVHTRGHELEQNRERQYLLSRELDVIQLLNHAHNLLGSTSATSPGSWQRMRCKSSLFTNSRQSRV